MNSRINQIHRERNTSKALVTAGIAESDIVPSACSFQTRHSFRQFIEQLKWQRQRNNTPTWKNIVRTSEGETATETVWSGAAASGGDVSCSGTRMPSSSATALNFEGLNNLRLLKLTPDEVQVTVEFLKWLWHFIAENWNWTRENEGSEQRREG